MKSFKHWLLTEDFATSDSSLTGDLMYPTSAGDYVYAANNPQELSWLQWKWDQESKQGRILHNINHKEFDKRGFVTLKSVTMPEKRWKHRSDSRPNIEIDNVQDLPVLAIGKNSHDVKELAQKTMIRVEFPLDQIFNDKPSGTWPDAAVDTKWTESLTREKLFSNWLRKSKFQEDMLPYDPVDGNLGANSQMGIPSKYIGPDETGEKDPKRKQPLANFGFDRKSEKLKKRLRRA